MAAQNWLSQGTLVLASNNKGKIAEFEKMFTELDLPVEVIPQGKLNIEDAIEDGLSFIENAIIKARHASRISGKPAIADDSGICVPILGGAPGIYSARYAGEEADAEANNKMLLQTMKFHMKRTCRFRCALAVANPAGKVLAETEGICEGMLLHDKLGEEGFGYDPLFFVPSHNCASAELDKAEKNRISHRGKAMQELLQKLSTLTGNE